MTRDVLLRRVLRWAFLLGALAAFALLCAFKILDRDFWWHVTAGKLLWETKALIAVEPFAYTRDGLPYLATHEWLAQLVLAGVYRFGGATGVIVLRTLMVTATFCLLLAIDGRRLWPNALLAVAGAGAVAGGGQNRQPKPEAAVPPRVAEKHPHFAHVFG